MNDNISNKNKKDWENFVKSKETDKALDMIDIGGPSLLRAASKNYKYITPVISTSDYSRLIKNIEKNHGDTDINFRKKMAFKVFKETSRYDKIISKWFNEK